MDLIGVITSFIFKVMLAVLPGWLARFFISPNKVAGQVEIDLRSESPLDISFGSDIPGISIYFRISNFSPLNLILERFLIDLWVGQPTLRGAILERQKIPKRTTVDNIFFRSRLSLPQQEHIRKHVSGQLLSLPITIYIKVYFESKIGLVYVEETLDRRHTPIK